MHDRQNTIISESVPKFCTVSFHLFSVLYKMYTEPRKFRKDLVFPFFFHSETYKNETKVHLNKRFIKFLFSQQLSFCIKW